MINYYKVLGVKNFAPIEEIKSAYRKLSKKLHPDVNDNDPFFTEKFKELQEAFECLNHSAKRTRYDSQLHNYLNNHNNTPPPHNNASSQNTRREEPKKEAPTASTAPLEKKRPVGSLLISLGIIVVTCFRIVSCFTSKSEVIADAPKVTLNTSIANPALPDTTSLIADTSSSETALSYDTSKSLSFKAPSQQSTKYEFFTVGSDKERVVAVQGEPIKTTDTYGGKQEWTFADGSTVTFLNGAVNEFDNNGKLKIQLINEADINSNESAKYSIGSTKDEVLAIQGNPSKTRDTYGPKQEWTYPDGNTITFTGDQLGEFNNRTGNLKVELISKTRMTLDTGAYYRVGSNLYLVLKIQGNPIEIRDTYGGRQEWTYPGGSRVTISGEAVADFDNSGGNLKIKY